MDSQDNYLNRPGVFLDQMSLPVLKKLAFFILDKLGEWDNREKFYSTHLPDEIIKYQNLESAEVMKVVYGFTESSIYRNENFIIEGIALFPGLVDENFISKFNINYICVGNTDYENFLKYSWNHRIEGDWLAETGQDTFSKVIRYSSSLSELFKSESMEHSIPYYEIHSSSFDLDLGKVISDITNA